MYRNILVPLDGSPFGEHALPLAVTLARKHGAALHLAHVLPPLASLYSETALFGDESFERRLREHQRARHQAYLDAVVARLRAAGVPAVGTSIQEGEVAPTLRARAVEVGADVVVMTTHARGGLARWWLGSVADDLARGLPMPLLLTRPADGPPDLTRDVPLGRVLLPLDGTPLAEQMLGPALDLAEPFRSSLTLLRVVRPLLPLAYPVEVGALAQAAQSLIDETLRVQERLKKEAADYLETQARKARARGLTAQLAVDAEDQPALAVLARQADADLIALETHGRRGLSRLFRGSVADKVIRGARVPVLVHQPQK
jgi:nucleotide-binding universal stress UspA family protein